MLANSTTAIGQIDSQAQGASGSGPEDARERLTPREVEVLRLMADGLTTKAIAACLGITFKTAACHRYPVLAKLGAANAVEAVRWALRNGLIEP